MTKRIIIFRKDPTVNREDQPIKISYNPFFYTYKVENFLLPTSTGDKEIEKIIFCILDKDRGKDNSFDVFLDNWDKFFKLETEEDEFNQRFRVRGGSLFIDYNCEVIKLSKQEKNQIPPEIPNSPPSEQIKQLQNQINELQQKLNQNPNQDINPELEKIKKDLEKLQNNPSDKNEIERLKTELEKLKNQLKNPPKENQTNNFPYKLTISILGVIIAFLLIIIIILFRNKKKEIK